MSQKMSFPYELQIKKCETIQSEQNLSLYQAANMISNAVKCDMELYH